MGIQDEHGARDEAQSTPEPDRKDIARDRPGQGDMARPAPSAMEEEAKEMGKGKRKPRQEKPQSQGY